MARKKDPSYRFHKARKCAVVTIAGHDHYLGEYESDESWEAYHRLVAEHRARLRQPPPPVQADAPLTITELIARYWRFAKGYYVKDGKPTSEVASIKLALGFVRRLYGRTAACDFSPKKLKAVRESMIAHDITRKVKIVDEKTGEVTWNRKFIRKGLARKCINKTVARIKRMFAWAVEEELVGVEVHAALMRVKGLKRGKTSARETPRVRPVSAEHIAIVVPLVPAMVRAMIEVQRLTGCRPQDVVQIRPVDIDSSEATWLYRPSRYKTEHHYEDGNPDLDRVIYLGPKAQEIRKRLRRLEGVGGQESHELLVAMESFLAVSARSPSRSPDEEPHSTRESLLADTAGQRVTSPQGHPDIASVMDDMREFAADMPEGVELLIRHHQSWRSFDAEDRDTACGIDVDRERCRIFVTTS